MITQATRPAGFIVYDDSAIFGLGRTQADAWLDFEATMEKAGITLLGDLEPAPDELGPNYTRRNRFDCKPATMRLLYEVERQGGDRVSWHVMFGMACFEAELYDDVEEESV